MIYGILFEKITDEEARTMLENAERDHDRDYGITWSTFDHYIVEKIKARV